MYHRDLVYKERFLIHRPDRSPVTAEYSEIHQQQVEVPRPGRCEPPPDPSDAALPRPQEENPGGSCPGGRGFCQIRGPLDGKTVAGGASPPEGAAAFLIDDAAAKPLPHMPHPLLVDECPPARNGPQDGGNRRPIRGGCQAAAGEVSCRKLPDKPRGPAAHHLGKHTLEGGTVLVFKGQARERLRFARLVPDRRQASDVRWTAEYVPGEMRIRRARFEARSSPAACAAATRR